MFDIFRKYSYNKEYAKGFNFALQAIITDMYSKENLEAHVYGSSDAFDLGIRDGVMALNKYEEKIKHAHN